MTDERTTPETAPARTDVPRCEDCPFRARAEARPRSFLAFLWRLHTKICPGWKRYQRWLAEQEAA